MKKKRETNNRNQNYNLYDKVMETRKPLNCITAQQQQKFYHLLLFYQCKSSNKQNLFH